MTTATVDLDPSRAFYENMQAFQAGSITLDQARERNREIRGDMPEAAWTTVKARALSQLARGRA